MSLRECGARTARLVGSRVPVYGLRAVIAGIPERFDKDGCRADPGFAQSSPFTFML